MRCTFAIPWTWRVRRAHCPSFRPSVCSSCSQWSSRGLACRPTLSRTYLWTRIGLPMSCPCNRSDLGRTRARGPQRDDSWRSRRGENWPTGTYRKTQPSAVGRAGPVARQPRRPDRKSGNDEESCGGRRLQLKWNTMYTIFCPTRLCTFYLFTCKNHNTIAHILPFYILQDIISRLHIIFTFLYLRRKPDCTQQIV